MRGHQAPATSDANAEEDIIRKAQRGDSEAFAQLYERHFDSIYRYIMLRIPTPTPRVPAWGGIGGFGYGFLSDAVVNLLGMTREQIRAERLAGKSLAQIAQEKGISEDKLIDTIVAAEKAVLDQLVKDGRITQAQADARLQLMRERIKAAVESTEVGPFAGRGFSRRGGWHMGGIGGLGLVSDAVTQLLGMTREQIRAERLAGKSLAQIAQEKGVSEDKLIDTILAPRKAHLDQLVKDGRITQAQADARLQLMRDRVKAAVESTEVGPFAGRGFGRHHGGYFGGRGGGLGWGMHRGWGRWTAPDANVQSYTPGFGMMGRGWGHWTTPDTNTKVTTLPLA